MVGRPDLSHAPCGDPSLQAIAPEAPGLEDLPPQRPSQVGPDDKRHRGTDDVRTVENERRDRSGVVQLRSDSGRESSRAEDYGKEEDERNAVQQRPSLPGIALSSHGAREQAKTEPRYVGTRETAKLDTHQSHRDRGARVRQEVEEGEQLSGQDGATVKAHQDREESECQAEANAQEVTKTARVEVVDHCPVDESEGGPRHVPHIEGAAKAQVCGGWILAARSVAADGL